MPRKATTATLPCPFCQKAIKPAGFTAHLKSKHPEWLARRGSEAWRKIKSCTQAKRPCRICGEHLATNAAWFEHHFSVDEHSAFKPGGTALTVVTATPRQLVADNLVNFCPCCRLNLTPIHVAVTDQRHGRIPLKLSGCPKCGLDLDPIEHALQFIKAH